MYFKDSIILLTLSLASLSAFAQPTMTRDWVGSVGDEFFINFATSVPSQGPAGADQIWDFTNIESDTITAKSVFAAPGETPYAMDFPESNLATGIEAFGVFSYLNIDNGIMEDLGNGNPLATTKNSDPRTLLEFPLTFNDSFQDTYASSFSAFGVTTFTNGTITATVDAYGTVELPGGTFDNCLRVKVVDQSVDSTDLGLGIIEKVHSTVTSYYWYNAATPGPLCYRDYTESFQVAIVPPLPSDTMMLDPDSVFVFDPNATSSSTKFFAAEAFDLSASPNPFTEAINLQFTLETAGEVQFELRSIQGELILARVLDGVKGDNTLSIETIESLPAGPYTAILKNDQQGKAIQLIKL